MALNVSRVRMILYAILVLLSIILFWLCVARLVFTTDLGFYDPIVVELLISTILAIVWSFFILYCIYKRVQFQFVSTFRDEIIGLFVLWLFWIIGCSIATSRWGYISCPELQRPCDVIAALLAFSWLGWIVITAILITCGYVTGREKSLSRSIPDRSPV